MPSKKSQRGKDMLGLLKTGPKNMARDKAQAQVVDKIVEGIQVEDQERALAESFAQKMGIEEHMKGNTSVKRVFTGGSGGGGELMSTRVPAPNERTGALAQVPRPLLRELLQGTVDPDRLPKHDKPRYNWTGDLLYATINLEGLATYTKLQHNLHVRAALATERAARLLKDCRDSGGDLEQMEEQVLEDLEFIDRVLGD